MLLLQLHENVQNWLVQKKTGKEELTEDSLLDSPFLRGLEKHVKNLCYELLQSKSELRLVEKWMLLSALILLFIDV